MAFLETIAVEQASKVWRSLNGVFCIYKPPGVSFPKLKHIVKQNLARDLNAMKPESPPELVVVQPPADESGEFKVTTIPDLRRHSLVIGPGYQPEDFYVKTTLGFLNEMAGVTLACIGSGTAVFDRITSRNPVCTYHIQGKFGLRTDDYLETGRVIEKTTYRHVTRGLFERAMNIYQGQFHKIIPQTYGVDPNSQDAYDLHAGGLARPRDVSSPLLYRLLLADFKPPYFTLELHCINETDKFLIKILNDLTEDMKTSAVCTKIRRVRWGAFTLDHALLKKHWSAQNIVTNISYCGPAVEAEMDLMDKPRVVVDEEVHPEKKFEDDWKRWREAGSITSRVLFPEPTKLLKAGNTS